MSRRKSTLLGIAGLSGSGKTTLVVSLIPELRSVGLRVGTLKHHRGEVELDTPGKDTWRHRRAGAAGTVISTPGTVGLIRDVDFDTGPRELAGLLPGMDIILAEGFKRAEIPKIEVYRPDLADTPVCLCDPLLLALVTTAQTEWTGPRFDPDDVPSLARFIIRRFALTA